MTGSQKTARAAAPSSRSPPAPAGMTVNRLSATRQAGVRGGVRPRGRRRAGAAGPAHRSRRGMPAVHSQTCWHSAATLVLSIPSSSR